MSELKFDKESVLELFGLEGKDVQDITYRNSNGSALIDVTLEPQYEPCPNCGTLMPKIRGYYLKNITHSVLTDRKCILNYHVRRYECRACHHTYREANPFVFGNMMISALTVQKILTDLKNYNETFSSVARRYHISPTTAASIFDNHVQIPRRTLPELINFDEVYAFRNYSDKYVCVLLDFKTHKPIDLLNSRRKDRLISYFMTIPMEERKKVIACSFDMYDTYRSVMRFCFPNSIGIVDHFHLCQELSRQVDRVRIRTMKAFRKDTDEYYLLKKFNWMLYRHSDDSAKDGKPLFDPNRERIHNYHFRYKLNYYDIREKLLNINPELSESWKLKENVNDFYRTSTDKTGEENFKILLEQFRTSIVPEMRHFARTLLKWKIEIINSLTVYSYNYKVAKDTGQVAVHNLKMSSALIENRNSIIKCIKKNANGYTNWDRFRNRTMYVLDKDATFSLNPIIKDSSVKSKRADNEVLASDPLISEETDQAKQEHS